MGWANDHIKQLEQGQTVSFRPHGDSMKGKITSGQLCTVEPISDELKVNDIVLCKVNGNQCLHLIKAIKTQKYQIGNNKGHINGWIGFDAIYGKLVKVED